jgi:hypothetical protein
MEHVFLWKKVEFLCGMVGRAMDVGVTWAEWQGEVNVVTSKDNETAGIADVTDWRKPFCLVFSNQGK